MINLKLLFTISLLIFFSSCGSYKSLDIDKISKLEFEYNPNQDLQYGTNFEAKINAVMVNGEEIDITDNKNLTIENNDVKYLYGHTFKITKKPFDRGNEVTIHYKLEGKESEMINSSDQLHLNFRGPLNIIAAGKNGLAGADGKDKNDAIVFRDGGDGDRGENGKNGQPGDNLQIHVWKDRDTLFLNVFNLSRSETWKYKATLNSTISINVSGGDGGIGGNGGDGGDGKDGIITSDKNKLPGDGGNGANGGNGGNGGNPGNVQITFHQNATDYQQRFSYVLNPGAGGSGGTGGKAGKAGTAEIGQEPGIDGSNGTAGMNGINGTGVNSPSISVQNFDWNQLN